MSQRGKRVQALQEALVALDAIGRSLSHLDDFTYPVYAVGEDGITITRSFVTVPVRQLAEGAAEFAEQAGASRYASDIRGIVRALWNGGVDFDQAVQLFLDTVRLGLTKAWHEGAVGCGIAPSELSPQERNTLAFAIGQESGYVMPFLDAVVRGSKANGGKLGPLMIRANLWANRYADLSNRAKMMACADRKLVWRLGPTMQHCDDCSNYANKVKRASQWMQANIRPQSPDLACGGWRCLCTLEPTDAPMSKGPLPRLRGRG